MDERLDHLEDGKGDDAPADQCAEDAPTLQLGDELLEARHLLRARIRLMSEAAEKVVPLRATGESTDKPTSVASPSSCLLAISLAERGRTLSRTANLRNAPRLDVADACAQGDLSSARAPRVGASTKPSRTHVAPGPTSRSG